METHGSTTEASVLTREQVRRVDRLAIESLGLPGIVLMENAAAALERAAIELLARAGGTGRALICCGPGNNGGDGFALARRLHVRSIPVVVLLTRCHTEYGGDAATNLHVAMRLGFPVEELVNGACSDEITLTGLLESHGMPSIVVDALLGTGAARAPDPRLGGMIRWMNRLRSEGALTLAVDVPTGLDCETGVTFGPDVVEADATVTLCAHKPGLLAPEAGRYVGELSVGDIGVPGSLIERARRGE